jgi:hypothetical protein
MAEAQVFGFQCKVYINDITGDGGGGSGSIGTPSWRELNVISDATLDMSFTESDASIRAAAGFELMEPGLLQLSLNSQMEWINDNPLCEWLLTAFFARRALDLLILTGERTNPDAKGVRGDFKLFKFPSKQDLKESVKNEISFKPSRSIRSNFPATASGTA